MPSLVPYKGLSILSPPPVNPPGDGGQAIQNNFVTLVDAMPTYSDWDQDVIHSVWHQDVIPNNTNDLSQNFYPGSWWLMPFAEPKLFLCQSSASMEAVWQPVAIGDTPILAGLGIGAGGGPDVGIRIDTTLTGDVTQYGVDIRPTFDSTATSNGVGCHVEMGTTAGSFTIPTVRGFLVNSTVLGSGSQISTWVGLEIFPQGVASVHHYGVRSQIASTETGGYNFFALGTAPNYFNGDIRLGTESAGGGSPTYNLVLGGGATSPVLGTATADMVSIAAVDNTSGDRRFYIQSELGSPISIGADRLTFNASTGYLSIGGTDIVSLTSSAMTLPDAVNIAVGSTTGTKIGTSASQLLGLWNATPVAQYSASLVTSGFSPGSGSRVSSGSSFTGNSGSTAYTIGDIVAALKACGIIAH